MTWVKKKVREKRSNKRVMKRKAILATPKLAKEIPTEPERNIPQTLNHRFMKSFHICILEYHFGYVPFRGLLEFSLRSQFVSAKKKGAAIWPISSGRKEPLVPGIRCLKNQNLLPTLLMYIRPRPINNRGSGRNQAKVC